MGRSKKLEFDWRIEPYPPLFDWRDERKYPKAKDPMWVFGFEFLCRNEKYRRWWYQSFPEAWEENRAGIDRENELVYDPSPWGLFFHPRPEHRPFKPKMIAPMRIHLRGEVTVPKGKIGVLLDPTIPHMHTLSFIADLLKRYTPKGVPREEYHQGNVWSRYLRLLDAKATKVKPDEIFDTLYPDEFKDTLKKYQANLRKARHLRDRGYRRLIFGYPNMNIRKNSSA